LLGARIWIGRKIIIVEQIKRQLIAPETHAEVQRKEQAAGRRTVNAEESGLEDAASNELPIIFRRRSSQRSWHCCQHRPATIQQYRK